MSQVDYWQAGSWNAVCYECGHKRKANTLARHWQGYYVCPEHNEARHPQDFVKGVPDIQTPPWTQPAPADVFINPRFITAILDTNGNGLVDMTGDLIKDI